MTCFTAGHFVFRYYNDVDKKEGIKMIIEKDMIIADVLAAKDGAAKIFMSYGSHCLTCANTKVKTVAEMAKKHEVNLDSLLSQLNELPDL